MDENGLDWIIIRRILRPFLLINPYAKFALRRFDENLGVSGRLVPSIGILLLFHGWRVTRS